MKLDALHLNEEINQRIKQPFLDSLQALTPNYGLYYRLQPEVELLVDTIIWCGSMGRSRPSTFGQKVLLMAYDESKLTRSRLALHYCLTVVSRYLKNLDEKRFHFRLEWLSKCIDLTENTFLALRVMNFFRFLKSGRWPSPIDYLLGLDYVSLKGTHNPHNIGSQYLMRELLWSASAELLATLLPIVNFRQLQRFLKNVLHLKSLRTKPTTVAQDREGTEKTEKSEASPKFTEESVCVNCEQRPHMPQFTGCAHIYCYYCLKSNILADKHFQCVVCDRPVSINSGQLNTSNHRSSLI